MKILEVVNIGYSAGGAEISVSLIRKELRKRGHEVRVLSSDMQGEGMFADYQLKTISPASMFKALQYLFYIRAYTMMRHIIREFQPDLIHIHTIEFFSPSILFAIHRIPVVMTVHGPEHFTLQLFPWCIPAHEYKKIPYDLTDLTFVGKVRYWYMRFLQRPLYRIGLRRVKVFLAPSRYMAEILQKDLPAAKIIQLYNGIHLPRSVPSPNNHSILYVGRLEKVKGVAYLIHAFVDVVHAIPDAQLRIVGDGAQRQELEELVTTLKLNEHVVFVGWIREDMVAHEYRDSVLLVAPSIWPEAFGLVIVEAMAVGRPVVGTQVGGIPELIEEGKTGYVVPARDSRSLTDRMIKLLNDREFLIQLGKNAVDSSRRFGVNRFVDKLENVYQNSV